MTADQILSRMMALCSRREYCRRDIEKKIAALSEEVDAAMIIDRLCKEKFLDEDSQVERLQKLLALKVKSVKAGDAEQLRTKLLRFALSRGFSYQQADSAFKKLKL